MLPVAVASTALAGIKNITCPVLLQGCNWEHCMMHRCTWVCGLIDSCMLLQLPRHLGIPLCLQLRGGCTPEAQDTFWMLLSLMCHSTLGLAPTMDILL